MWSAGLLELVISLEYLATPTVDDSMFLDMVGSDLEKTSGPRIVVGGVILYMVTTV